MSYRACHGCWWGDGHEAHGLCRACAGKIRCDGCGGRADVIVTGLGSCARCREDARREAAECAKQAEQGFYPSHGAAV